MQDFAVVDLDNSVGTWLFTKIDANILKVFVWRTGADMKKSYLMVKKTVILDEKWL